VAPGCSPKGGPKLTWLGGLRQHRQSRAVLHPGLTRGESGVGEQRGDVLERTPAEVLRELAYDLASQVAVVPDLRC
jgi:hypothetical protein